MNDPVTLLESIPAVGPYVPYILAAGAVCAAIATVLPPPKPDDSKAYKAIYTAINWCALNIGHAKNAPASDPTPKA